MSAFRVFSMRAFRFRSWMAIATFAAFWLLALPYPATQGGSGTAASLFDCSVAAVICVDGTNYDTIPRATAALEASGGGTEYISGSGPFALTTNLFSGVTVPIQLVFTHPAEVDIAATQTIAANAISIVFLGQNPAISRIGSSLAEAAQTRGLRFKAIASLSGPLFQVNGPILGFNLTNVHFDCNANATYAVQADRMQASVWSGVISADECTSGGFKFPNGAKGSNQDTAFNQMGMLFVTRSPQCFEADQNGDGTSDFDHNIIGEIGCSLLGTGGTTDEVYFQGADGNVVQRIWCQIEGGGVRLRPVSTSAGLPIPT